MVVAQKLMKLLLDVRDATWPAAGTCWPSFSKPFAMTEGSNVVEVCRFPPPFAVDLAAALEDDLLPPLARTFKGLALIEKVHSVEYRLVQKKIQLTDAVKARQRTTKEYFMLVEVS